MMLQKIRDAAAWDSPRAEVHALRTADIRFVEFFGLPGVGKTTACRLFVERLRQCGTVVEEAELPWAKRGLIGRQIGRLLILLPELSNSKFRSLLKRIVRFVRESGQESVLDQIRVAWNLSTVVAYVLQERSRDGSIIVLDQGLLQGFWSVLLKSKRRGTSETWHDILTAIGVHDVVFVRLRAKTRVARGRLLARGDRSSRMQTANSDPQLWPAAERAHRQIATDLRKGMQSSDRAVVLAGVDVQMPASPEEVAQKTLEAVLSACRERNLLRDSASR
jgi:hypothetical protein